MPKNPASVGRAYDQWEKALSAWLAISLTICFFFGFFVDSGKHLKNIYYVLFGLPALVSGALIIRRSGQHLSAHHIPLALLFTTTLAASLFHSGADFIRVVEPILFLSALFLGLTFVHINHHQEKLLTGLTLFSLACSLWLFYAGGHWLESYRNTGEFSRATFAGIAENPVHASLIVVFFLSFLWAFKIEPRIKDKNKTTILMTRTIFAALVIFTCLIFESRSTLLGFIFFCLTYALLLPRSRQPVVITALLILAIIGTPLLDILLSRGFSFRLEIWQDTLVQFSSQCDLWFGCGPAASNTFAGSFRHPHSAYLSTLFFHGLLSTIALSLFLIHLLWLGFKAKSPWLALATMGWAALTVTSSGVMVTPRPLWIYVWLPTFMALITGIIHLQSTTAPVGQRENTSCPPC